MKKYINVLLPFFIILFFITACAPPTEIETVSTETFITDMTTATETEEETVEEFTDYGEKIITFKISKEACERWFGVTTSRLKEILVRGEHWIILYNFVGVEDKNTHVELKMSESNIKECKKRMFEYLGVGPSDKLEKNSFFYYNEEYNKMVAYVSEEENIGAFIKINDIHFCLMTLQMFNRVDSDDWNVDITIINSDTGNVVIEMKMGMEGHEKYELTADDWK